MTEQGGSAEPSRPRPQYGEYATTEEQLRRSGREAAPVPPGLAPPAISPHAAASHALPPRPGAPSANTPASTAGAVTPAHPIDRIAALALLAYGLWNVITSVITFLDPSTLIGTMMQMLGVSGTFTNYGQAKVLGIVAAVILIVGWTLTAAWTVLRLRRGKRTWWVPVLGGAVFVTLSSICILVAFYSDPAVVSYIQGLTTTKP
ncbi:DUF6264 family protein [uncultured Microbacterium sp.]|uniref:DUF6264 family protein n=1 Tax=uncultured Microbacterium sp. TaxID=191216 RepID=UPI0025F8AA34|nr:DUF6264 family protein [uncultured Microbacterium sp.]